MSLTDLLCWVGVIWLSLLWFLAALALYVARTRYNGRSMRPSLASQSSSSSSASAPDATTPGVSILRPLRGLDCNLYENCEASFLQDYPNYEIIFSVADETDAAIPIVQELMSKYPRVSARLMVGEEVVGVNPKINNLIRPYRLATHDILWVLDSNVLTSTQTLANSVALLTAPPAPGARPIGLVHHLPFAIYPDQSLGSRVEQVFLCTTHAKMYLAINQVAIASCVTGKSCLYRKSVLELAADKKREGGKGHVLAEGEGGLAAFGKYLGEDNMIGEAIWDDLGMRHAMGGDLAGNAVGSMSFATFFRRRVRWIRVRKYMVIASTLVEPLTECFASAILASFVLSRLFSFSRLLVLITHIVLWYTFDNLIYLSLVKATPTRTRQPAHDGPSYAFFKAWLVRESMALPIWCFAMSGNTVGWRDDGKTYRVKTDGSVGLVGEQEGRPWEERVLERSRRAWGEKRYEVLRPDDEEEGGARGVGSSGRR